MKAAVSESDCTNSMLQQWRAANAVSLKTQRHSTTKK